MLPGIRLVIAAIIASVVLIIGGFGLVATFQIAKTSIGGPPRGAAPPDPALADRPERNKVYAFRARIRLSQARRRTRPPRAAPTMKTSLEPRLILAQQSPPVSPSLSDDAGPDQISGIDARPERGPAIVALTDDLAPAKRVVHA